MAQFEYKFVRIGKGWFWPSSESEREYRDTIRKHAREGWRLVQVFAPSNGIYGLSRYYEIILERPISEN